MDRTPVRRGCPDVRRLGLWLLTGLSLLAPLSAWAQNVVYYSVGTSFPTDLKSGAPTVGIAAGTATFSLAQPANVGVGDEVTYGGGVKAYISARTSSTVYDVRTAFGTVPAGTVPVAVNSITRAFGTLTAAIAGSSNASHLNTLNLVVGNFQLNWAIYNDGPMNDGGILIDGYTTGAANYIRIFTPVPPGQVGSRQRHVGRAGTGFRLVPVNAAPPTPYEVIRINDDHVRIEGIEIDASRVTGAFDLTGIRVVTPPATADVRIDKVLVHDVGNAVAGAGTPGDLSCINLGGAGVRLSNSLCYAVHNNNSDPGSDTYGIRVSASSTATLYFHNNTIYDVQHQTAAGLSLIGISKGGTSTVTVRNTAVLNVKDTAGLRPCFGGTFSGSSSNNVSSDGTAPGAGSQINRTSYASYFRSVVSGAEDLHLLNDGLAIWGANGADLDADANLPVVDDVDGEARHATAPDIGADEFVAVSGPQMRVESGRYVGNGVAGRFVYVGFQPDVVMVKQEGAVLWAVFSTSTMPADRTKSTDKDAPLALFPGAIQSLNAQGFTVGADAHVNDVAGSIYHWVAFRAAAGQLVVDSYMGDGIGGRSITGVGFEPDYVIVLPAAGGLPDGLPIHRSSTMTGDTSYDFDADQLGFPFPPANAILAFEPNGFQIGNAAFVNTPGATYHYVAWNAVPGRTAVGSYTGTSSQPRIMDVVGFLPEWLLIKWQGDNRPWQQKPASSGVSADFTPSFVYGTGQPDSIQALRPLGFELGGHERVNLAGETYHWVAFGPHAPQINYRSIGTASDLTNQGTITVTADSTTVTKVGGTGWLAANRGRGDRLNVGGQDYMIARVVTDNLLILASPAVANATNPYTIARQFGTLQAWENCISFNSDGGAGSDACTFFDVASVSLVDDDRSEVGIAYNDSSPASAPDFSVGVKINGGITDAGHTITLTADAGNRHYGIPGAGVRVTNAGPIQTVWILDDYVTVEWLELESTGAAGGIYVQTISTGSGATAASRLVLRNNLIHGIGFGISLDDGDEAADVYNNIVYSCANSIRILSATLFPWTQIRILNNTMYDYSGSGFDSSVTAGGMPQQITLINNIAVDPEGAAQPSFVANSFAINGASRNNLSSDTRAGLTFASPGGGGIINQDYLNDVDFVNAAAFNLHIQPTSTAVNAGVDLSSLFAFDIDFAIRQTPWDIGADDQAATTAVKLQSSGAIPGDRSVLLEWRTASELSNLGFHVYRSPSENGPWARLTSSLIPGLSSSAVGQAYSFRDTGLVNGTRYFYRLEDVDASSKTTSHGPVSAVPSPAPPAGDGGGTDGDTRGGKKKSSAASSCPDWVLAAYGSAVGSDVSTVSLRCTRHGDPEAVSLGVLSRDSRSVTLELRTGGFYALHEASGTVRVFVPGFDFPQDERAAALPIRRVLAAAVIGRRVQLGGVRALDLARFSLVPSALGKAEMQVGRDGTVRAVRHGSRAVAKQFPKGELVNLLPSLFQGERKSAVVEIAPLRFDVRRQQLVLAKRVLVRLLFTGREAGESGRGSLGRAPGSRKPVSGELLARLHTMSRGLHAVSFEQLFPGRPRGFAASQLRLERQGGLVAFHVEPATDAFGPGSRLYFYAHRVAASTDFSAETAYELIRSKDGLRMPLVSAAPSGEAIGSASTAFASFETNRFYQPGLLEAKDPWLWEAIATGATRVKSFALAAVDAGSSQMAELDVFLQGASESGQAVDHHVSVSVNGTLVGEAQFAGKRPYRMSLSVPVPLLREGASDLSLTSVADTGVSSFVFLDRFSLAYPQAASLSAGIFEGTWAEAGTASVSGVSAGVLLDVSGAASGAGGVRWLSGFESSGGSLRFRAEAGRRYIAVSHDALLSPRIATPEPATLRATTNQADYLLIAPKAFLAVAEPLLQLRADQGLTTRAVSFEEIAEQFGHGQPSAEAIRSFLAFAFHSWNRPSPRYVLLLGDSTYDPRNFIGTSQPSPLPVLWAKTSYLWTVSDPLLAAVNGEDSLPDIAIGRLPATTVEEAQRLIDKLLAWEDSGQGLSGPATLVADNPDLAGDFEADVEDIRASFLASREVLVLKLSELGAATRPSILDSLNSGLSFLSYVGHGGAAVWASENVWNSWDAASLQAQSQQPLLVTMNCLNGYFVAPSFDSLSESLLKAEGRGAIASFSPSGLSLDGPAHQYHRALMAELTSGQQQRLGDAILAAQKSYADSGLMPELLGVYHLLGDPAMRLR